MKSPRLVFFLLLFICIQRSAYSTHLMGGSLTYEYVGINSNFTQYHVTLKIYRYCDQTNGTPAALDASMMLGIYTQDTTNAAAPKDWFETDAMQIVSQQFITPPSPSANCTFTTTVCVEEGVYETDIFLPVNAGGYHLVVERCCRNGNIVNLSAPGTIGQAYYCFIPPDPVINSSPVFPDIGVPFICTNAITTVVNNATDPDGDVLEYALVAPNVGYSSSSTPMPDPAIDNNPYGMPIPQATYNPGYSATQPFGPGGFASIDAVTGQTTYSIPNQGFYVVVMEIREYRNGVLIASVRRDIQLIAIPCPLNNVPLLSNANGSGTTNYVITEGQTLCFPVTFTDADGDSLWLSTTGNIFNGAVVNPPATLTNANDSGTVTSQFCWTTQCGQAQAAPYQFNVNVLDNGCPPQQTNQVYSITVNPNPSPPVPQVTIAANPAGPVCAGTSVTFTATPSFGGAAPVYQWQVNGMNVGANSTTFTTNALNTGDVVTCIMTSNSQCVTVFVANSNPLVMTVDPLVVPVVNIVAYPSGTICYGTNVTFTAVTLNAGSAPFYQWQVNGLNAGTNSPTFSSATLVAGNTVSVTVIPNSSCPGTASSSVTMSVLPIVTPSVTIAANPGSTICPWTNVTFTATPVNGGTLPSYQWQVNGTNAGTNSPVFSPASLQTGDVVNVVLTSNAPCSTTNQDSSNLISITVLPILTPAVSISANPPGTICAGTNVTFNANTTNGGPSPSYQWTVNGSNAGTGATFSSTTLQTGDVIHLDIISNAYCLSTPSAASNSIAMTVIPVYMPAVSIVSSADSICPGTNVVYTATPVNGGVAPVYHWTVNGISAGTNSPVFSSSTLSNLDKIKVTLTSSIPCPAVPVVNSNLIVIHVRPNLTPNITISANPYPPAICHDSMITYWAAWSNGGTSPHFQWLLNGAAVGSDTGIYISHTIQNGDIISVVLTSNALCVLPPVDSSNKITTLVDYMYTPDISISANPGGQFCDGKMITYTAAVAHEGMNPAYHWRVNGVNINATGNLLITDQLQNEDTLSCVLTSSIICPSVNPVHSNELIIDRLPPLQPEITGTDEICIGKEASLLVTTTGGTGGPYYYLWDNNLGTDSSYNLFPDVTTTYNVTVSDSCSKWRGKDYTVVVNPLPVPEFIIKQEKPTILNSFIDFVDKSFNAAEWLWNFGDASTGTDRFAHHIFPDTGFYEVQLIVTSSKGCMDSISHPLYIEDVTTVYFPNSFTPNADGKNDYFAPGGHEIPSYEMTVYNRWGEVVFFTNTSLEPWTGLLQKTGDLAPEGSYIYIAKFNSGAAFKKQVLQGQVTLIR